VGQQLLAVVLGAVLGVYGLQPLLEPHIPSLLPGVAVVIGLFPFMAASNLSLLLRYRRHLSRTTAAFALVAFAAFAATVMPQSDVIAHDPSDASLEHISESSSML